MKAFKIPKICSSSLVTFSDYSTLNELSLFVTPVEYEWSGIADTVLSVYPYPNSRLAHVASTREFTTILCDAALSCDAETATLELRGIHPLLSVRRKLSLRHIVFLPLRCSDCSFVTSTIYGYRVR